MEPANNNPNTGHSSTGGAPNVVNISRLAGWFASVGQSRRFLLWASLLLLLPGLCLTLWAQSGTPAVAQGPTVSTHSNKGFSGTQEDFELLCNDCHYFPHGDGPNLALIGTFLKLGPVTVGPVVFTSTTGINSFDDGISDASSRVCVTCHINPNRPGSGTAMTHPGGENHQGGGNYTGQDCTGCHPHDADDDPATLDGFMPAGGCTVCHATPQDNGDNLPVGGRRAIVDEFSRNSHHADAAQDGDCLVCHQMQTHMNGYVQLKNVDDPTNLAAIFDEVALGNFRAKSISNVVSQSLSPFCLACHDSDGANGDTSPFSDDQVVPPIDSAAWSVSAHDTGGTTNSGYGCLGDGSGSGCHATGHGSTKENLLAPADVVPDANNVNQEEGFCYGCHTEGQVMNNAISGPALADDIEQSFSLGGVNQRHSVLDSEANHSFTIGGQTFELECTTCHNPHVVSGKYWEADQGRSPITRPDFSNPAGNPVAMGATLWGAVAGQKMDDYAGGGTYRTPKSDTFSGSQLPDYATFCLDCHGQSGSAPFGINWNNDPHGKNSANQPNGYGTCPNWYSCGKAFGWDNDDCVAADKNECWPVIPRGAGDQLFSRLAYTHTVRIAGGNFTLSCTDCHEAHGSNVSSILRANPNAGTGSTIWNTMCNNCHYYYSDWHAGMSCGNASCHVSGRMSASGTSTLHEMSNAHGSGGTRTFNSNLVLNYRFENNLKDSGGWQMDGKWMDNIAGSFTAGKSGQALVLDGGKNVQVGTENDYWSTDAGYHGTWVYTEMKFNTTLEAWVYPTDNTADEYIIFSKHVGVGNDGGYTFALKKINGALRATFNMAADNNGVDQGGRAGVRGAYSAVAVPLNTWTHVAATFDAAGPDRDPADPGVGRIRIYVNGEDVTTSDLSGDNMQPGAGETSIYAYAENSPWNQGICFNGTWCASEFSVGGFYGWQNEFIGRIDEAKVWNITKDATYFEAVDTQTPPYIGIVEGMFGSNLLQVTFSEGVYASTGSTGALEPTDFTLADSDDGRTIVAVTHTAGRSTAILTLSSALDTTDDIGVDTLAAAGNAVFDEYDNPAETTPVAITLSGACPTGPTSFQFNDPAGSNYILDQQQLLFGTVNDPTQALLGDGYLTGDGLDNYIDFENNNTCLQASTALTIETRIRPSGLQGTATYIKRIFARDSGGNYQMSVWRNNSWTNYNAPDGTASIAFWVSPVDSHGGNAWKPALTDYNACPIVSDHWYQVRVVWDSNKPGGTPGQFFVPADIFVDDQGTDGLGTGENWSGDANCTNADQSYNDDVQKLYTGDQIRTSDGNFVIGANVNNRANNVFSGLIDWISFDGTAAISGASVSVSSGNWNDDTTWDGGVPGPGDTVIIGPGTTVIVNSSVQANNLQVENGGVLAISPGSPSTAWIIPAADCSAHVYDLDVTFGGMLVISAGCSVTVEGTLTNSGALRQTQSAVPGGANTQFLRIKNLAGSATKYYGVDIDPTAEDMGSTTVTIYGNQVCPNSTPAAIRRCYDIVPATVQAATISFYYHDAEENGQDSAQIWHWNVSSAAWELQTFDSRDRSGVENNWVKITGAGSYSPFSGANAVPVGLEPIDRIYLPVILK